MSLIVLYFYPGSILISFVRVSRTLACPPNSNCHVEFFSDVQCLLSQDVDAAGSFQTSPNSMESMMYSGMSRPPIRIASESKFFVGEIPALWQVGLNEDDIRQAHKMDNVATLQSLRLFPNDLSRMQVPLCRLVPMPMVCVGT